jgi:hypothetical protein
MTPFVSFRHSGHVRHLRLLAGVQHVVPVAGVAVAVQLRVAGHAPDVGGDVVLLEHLLRGDHLVEDRAAAEELRPELRLAVGRRLQPVHPLQDPLARPLGHRRHGVLLVHHGQVVEDALLLAIHPADAVLDDHRQLVGVRRVVRDAGRVRQRVHVALAVLVLQPLPRQRRPAGGGAEQEAADARVGAGPDQVGDALEAEHRVEDEERDRVDAVGRVGGAGRDERRHRAGLGDPSSRIWPSFASL